MTKNITIIRTLLLLLLGAAGLSLPITINAQTIHGSVYGGAQIAEVGGNATVTIYEGSFGADIFGGGKGELNDDSSVKASADIGGNTTVNINGGEFSVVANTDEGTKETRPFMQRHNIYGGGNVACKVGTLDGGSNLVENTGNAYLNMAKGMVSNTSDGTDNFLVSEEGAMDLVYEQEGKMFFCTFGGGFGKNTIIRGNTYVDFNVVFAGCQDITTTGLTDNLIDYQSVLDVVGGGFNGSVGGNTYVHVGGDAMCRNLYGGGLYATIGGDTYVDVTGGNIDNVYGGGVMGDILGSTGTLVTIGLHESESHQDAAGNTITYEKDNAKITILGSVYGGNDVSGHVRTATIKHLGGTIDQNIYGAGNGDYTAYYEPGLCAFKEGENDNYIVVNNGVGAPNGIVYKARPHTDNVSITMGGASEEEKAVVQGQVFVGGNSCTIGQWNSTKLITDPEAFEGGGQAYVTLNNHVVIGYTNADLTAADVDVKALYLRDGENVSGLYMGCSGDHLATQTTAPDDRYYHRYYDRLTNKYWPGFPVYSTDGDGSALLTRQEGQDVFDAYLNNILLWTDNVTLTFGSGATDIWLANFVGGGFRGSVKAKTEGKQFAWILPAGVTIGNNVVGGAYNTDVVYRIFRTSNGHEYTTTAGQYEYRIDDSNLTQGTDYHHIEYAADGTTITGIVRFNYAGGILKSNGTPADITLTLNNNMDGGDVYGGCFASGTVGSTTINYYANGADNVYGGGALANVAGNTNVNLFDGWLTNAYGGGLGRKANTTSGDTAVEALVSGDASVVLGKADRSKASEVRGSIFGCNNVNGTPKGQATVHVMRTVKRNGQTEGQYDVAAVYGGGNNAAYKPTADDKSAKVIIEGCESSIENVYGGGNAAAVPGTDVTIYGGQIGMAFGGGNGMGDGNPGADVGYLGYYSVTGDVPGNYYGPGTANLTIYGGTIEKAFGGSNTLGYIRQGAVVNIDEMPDADKEIYTACPLDVENVHGGGNQAPMFCDGVVNCNCIKGVDVIFAGSDNADIHGDINMNITSGTYAKVFGGNNRGGKIEGSISINIDETGCWPVMIGELYGCGNDAPYSVYGYTNEGPRTKAQYDALTDEQKSTLGLPYAAPSINIISATKIGNIFGGGCGEHATVYGDIAVNVNMIKGAFAGQTVSEGMMTLYKEDGIFKRKVAVDAERIIPNAIGTIENVFGGGDAAEVVGNTTVNIGTVGEKVKHLNAPESEGENVGANITGDVFGGGNKGQVTGSTNVNVGNPS